MIWLRHATGQAYLQAEFFAAAGHHCVIEPDTVMLQKGIKPSRVDIVGNNTAELAAHLNFNVSTK